MDAERHRKPNLDQPAVGGKSAGAPAPESEQAQSSGRPVYGPKKRAAPLRRRDKARSGAANSDCLPGSLSTPTPDQLSVAATAGTVDETKENTVDKAADLPITDTERKLFALLFGSVVDKIMSELE